MTKIIIISIILLISTPALAGTPSQHLIVADFLEGHTQTNTQAFLLGFASHAALDSIRPQHYNFDVFSPQEKDYDIIALEGLLSGYLIFNNWDNEKKRWAYLGAMAPDIIEAAFVLSDRQRWYNGDHFFFWHDKGRPSRMSKPQTMGISITLFSASIAF